MSVVKKYFECPKTIVPVLVMKLLHLVEMSKEGNSPLLAYYMCIKLGLAYRNSTPFQSCRKWTAWNYKEKQGFLELMRMTITDLVGSLWSEIKLLTFIVDSSVYYSLTLSATFITSCLILFSIGRGQFAEI